MFLLYENLWQLTLVRVPTLIIIAFITLIERKIIGSVQNRKGPNKTSPKGALQPIADALKLFLKNSQKLSFTYYLSYFGSPALLLASIFCLWVVIPWKSFITTFKLRLFILLNFLILEVYCLFLIGWASNNKFSILGSIRAIVQILAFDINFTIRTLIFLILSPFLNIQNILKFTYNWASFKIFLPLPAIILTLFLIDRNRTPFDFRERERELVSGFNTEFFAAEFILIFMAEYGKILLLAMVHTLFYYMTAAPVCWYLLMLFNTLVWFLARASLPRYRYDLIIKLRWNSILPLLLIMFLYWNNF